MKANAGVTTRPNRHSFPVHFVGGGQDFEVTFRELGLMELQAAKASAEDLTVTHITGTGKEGLPGYKPAIPLPPVNGGPVTASPDSFVVASILSFAQVNPEGGPLHPDERYSAVEWLQFCVDDQLAIQVLGASEQITKNIGETEVPKATGSPSSTSAETPTQPATLNS